MRSVNEVFYENTPDSAYATLFFAEVDDHSKRLRYANCGHLPGLLLRANGDVQRLAATGTVLGLFKHYDCAIEERFLESGDLIALYTDGLTESSNDIGEEFGEQRLLNVLGRQRALSSSALVRDIVDEIREFSRGEQQDDITLIVGKC